MWTLSRRRCGEGESSSSVCHQSNRLYNQPLAGFDFSRRALGRVDPFLDERTDRKGLARKHFTSSARFTSKKGSLFVLMFSSWMALFEVSFSFISFHTSLVDSNRIFEKRALQSHTNYVRFLVHWWNHVLLNESTVYTLISSLWQWLDNNDTGCWLLSNLTDNVH